jgi:subfamily B ATP-binding cassette protein MsbA
MTKESSATAAELAADRCSSPRARWGSIVYIALAQSESGRFDFALFMSYVVALLTLLERLKGLSGINAAIQRGLAAAESIFGLLDHEEEADTGTVVLDQCRGEVRFERLSLRYAANEREALSDITLTVAPGETVALVGASGAGKTSWSTSCRASTSRPPGACSSTATT